MSVRPLHVITDDAVLADAGFAARARDVLAGGGTRIVLHLRGPRTSGRRLYEHACALLPEARAAGAWIVVNDRVDVARAAGAHGVQLGRRSLAVQDARTVWPQAWIGCSVHSAGEAAAAAAAGTDCVVLGTIYPTPSHRGDPGAGADSIRAAAALTDVPVVAIGGVDGTRVAEVASAGASGVAVIRAVWREPDPALAVTALLEAWDLTERRSM